MLDLDRFRLLATQLPLGVAGTVFHRWGLDAMHRGRYPEADRLFERGAAAYRRVLSIEPLARLRVHQLMAVVRAGRDSRHEAERSLQVERLLSCLDRIESPEPDFSLVEAHALLASWRGTPHTAPVAASSPRARAA